MDSGRRTQQLTMNKRLLFVFTMAVLGAALAQCYYDQEGILYPDTCNPTSTPTFRTDVLPLLQARCNNCHSGSFASANVSLETHTQVVARVQDGSLLGTITHAGGFSPMPKNSTRLSACDIQKIQAWVEAGSLNN